MYAGYALRNNGNMVFWNPNDKYQQWKFDEVSKTIKNVAQSGYSLGIHQNQLNYFYTKTNSRWM